MAKTPRASSVRRPLILGLKIAGTALAVWLIALKVDFSGMATALWSAKPGWLFVGIACQFLAAGLNAIRWKVLIRAPGVRLHKYLYYVFVGHWLNVFMPSAALAEGLRTYAFGKRYGDVQRNLIAAVLARACGLLVQLALAAMVVAIHWSQIKTLFSGSGLALDYRIVALAIAAMVAATVVALLFFRDRLSSVTGTLFGYVRAPGPVFRALWVSFCLQGVIVLGAYALFRSVGADVRLWHMAVIPALIQIILILPLSFGGVGVREYLSLLFFSGFAGIPREVTLAGSILGYVPWVLLAATGGLWMLFRSHSGKELGN